ncbi:MAG: hypothetical protein NTY36_03225 [Deltaproteobacteria bacterium]|nr:hypothetical protein [Deltaproteobacteria bacterium]
MLESNLSAWWGGAPRAVALFTACCRSRRIVKEAQTQVVTDHVADFIHGKSVAVDLEYYDAPKYYDTLHRARQQATYRPASIINSLMIFGQSGISLIVLAGFANQMYDRQRRHTQAER